MAYTQDEANDDAVQPSSVEDLAKEAFGMPPVCSGVCQVLIVRF